MEDLSSIQSSAPRPSTITSITKPPTRPSPMPNSTNFSRKPITSVTKYLKEFHDIYQLPKYSKGVNLGVPFLECDLQPASINQYFTWFHSLFSKSLLFCGLEGTDVTINHIPTPHISFWL
ncbi:hypothetical protein O181_024175 [Austropuccinia psidii MF-1]|uniref:Uncharacterized protein n=1 Tax=Austropuccinia psidii MF-1 TaxID=1389203 RepID=A0A9Q3CK19_9BASI|nr:hypothetical protein [Austropuccinia psidii MF-1]